MTNKTRVTMLSFAFGVSLMSFPVFGQQGVATNTGTLDKASGDRVFATKAAHSPYVGRNFPNRPFFGDTHVHTSTSADAGAFGSRLTPADAYRFGRGEEIMASRGQRVKLTRPLDFVVVADHSDAMGMFPLIFSGDPRVMATEKGRKWYEQIRNGEGGAAALDIVTSFGAGTIPPPPSQPPEIVPVPVLALYRSVWEDTIRAAEDANTLPAPHSDSFMCRGRR